ncbi:4Fe-4S dicluster domain-containing protein [Candidatus Atribacteria bacterium 1244-E10-H5-B2]|nr:MAG: 4Fe-4S dicluster domain-containing protein [Candidatus Atribacteria bacterium 1244-E10-H5-B2]
MLINKEKCISCKNCQPYCPANAIFFTDKDDVVFIDQELCFECGTCLRVGICKVGAIYESPSVYEYPRSVRKFFSDPTTTHKETNMPGRGTEEVKTNDVTNRCKKGEVGVALEAGRPTVGTRLYEVEKITMGIAKAGFNNFEESNPVSGLMANPITGKFKKEVLNERVLSVIIEFICPENELERCLNVIHKLSKQIDTVFTMSLITCYEPGMKIRIQDIIDRSKFIPRNNAKINIGIGRKSN